MKYDSNNLNRNDEQFTPLWVFEGLGLQFDLDVCAPIERKDHVPASNRLTVLDDGLAQQWLGRVWMNPPYSKPTPWVQKFIEHGNGIALVPVTRSKWFHELWSVADAVMLTPANMKFDRPDNSKNCITFQTVLVALSEENVAALARLKTSRIR
jgi:hypothetical protein